MEGKNNWVEEVFSSQSCKVEVYSEDKVLNPFTVLNLRFFADGKLVKESQTIFKCDVLEGCFFCFTHDLSHVVLAVGREKKTIPTEYKNLLLWAGCPILEENFYDEVFLLGGGMLMAKKERKRFFVVFKSLLVEEGEGVVRLVVDANPQNAIFTENFNQELFLSGSSSGLL